MVARCLYIRAMLIYTLILLVTHSLHGISMNSRHDPYPPFTTLDPYTLVDRWHRQWLLGYKEDDVRERAHIAISAYGQNADQGRDACSQRVELGDLNGRWNMIGLLYGAL